MAAGILEGSEWEGRALLLLCSLTLGIIVGKTGILTSTCYTCTSRRQHMRSASRRARSTGGLQHMVISSFMTNEVRHEKRCVNFKGLIILVSFLLGTWSFTP